ncbi:MAG: hypothetical protein EWV67_18580 [Microcystis sp. M_QC_C_20170808_M2Col]|nr:MAG: hypothetical protein EWV67_18580 [Microcystis sp. M_QC_C_20170808_M2Col]TRT69982.1 MAG: hypothetical protein EWV68_07595 [Microcystis sp. M_QC_C_20170808_M9Col]
MIRRQETGGSFVLPITLHPTPYTPHPTPHTPHPTPHHPTPPSPHHPITPYPQNSLIFPTFAFLFPKIETRVNKFN